MAVPQRSGLESRGHSVTDGKTILSKGKVSTTDFMGFSIQPASSNSMFNFWLLISMSCPKALQCLPPLHLDRKKIIKWLFDGTMKSKQTNQKKDIGESTGSGIDFMINKSLCCRWKEFSEKVIQISTNVPYFLI